ncbi:MAG: signal peptidase I [Cyanobacteriota bacterium]|nr:signal peptidase I [Cyanobacteriota bacterium]
MTSEKKSLDEQVTKDASQPKWLLFWRKQTENLQILGLALAISVLIRLLIAEPRYIPSDSMLPTLNIGDRLVIEKVYYRFKEPTNGDIIVFEPPDILQQQGYSKDQAFIKRIIGLPGQTIDIKNGLVFIGDRPLEEDYIAELPDYFWQGPVTIPEDQYFVMGDNRNNSNDSHIWGFLPKENIIGRAVFRFWPFERIGFL